MKRIALDLFCGEGGASMGLYRAGFEVWGVDSIPMPRYPFNFIQADALKVSLDGFDFIWASPVCKRYSSLSKASKSWDKHPDQIGAIRERLKRTSAKWVIENVAGAPLLDAVMLCGASFGLRVYRHRFFESNFEIVPPNHLKHKALTVKIGRPPKAGMYLNPAGHFPDLKAHGEAMGINWMSKAGLSQSIPPAYSEYIGRGIA